MEYDEDDFRFKSKYVDRNAHRGVSMTHKHKNQEVVEKIHSINHQDVF